MPRPLSHRAVAHTMKTMFTGLAGVGRLHPRSKPAVHGVEVLRDIHYGEAEDGVPERHLDVYRPSDLDPAAGPPPVVIYVHGGAFRSLSKDTHWLLALAYARRGYVVFNIDYRLAPAFPYPAALQDVCAAARWVQAHAAEYGGDPSCIVLGGESAGANLITALTAASCWRRSEPWAEAVFQAELDIVAVTAVYGILQVADAGRFARRKRLPWAVRVILGDVENCYLGPGVEHDEAVELASPLLFFEGGREPDRPLPAFFLPVGTADVLLDDTRRMAAALERRGVPHEARYYPGEVHGFHALVWRQQARDCWADLFSFLDSRLGEAAPSPTAQVLAER